jgi:hypothetical protein
VWREFAFMPHFITNIGQLSPIKAVDWELEESDEVYFKKIRFLFGSFFWSVDSELFSPSYDAG